MTEPRFPPPPAGPVTIAVAFQPFSVANGSNVLISAVPLISKLPLNAVSPASHKAIEVMKLFIVPEVVLPTFV
jgi:hypothetical protein